ncbi:hypothetical protein KR018_009911 [Drosophila ironensis]|nr:hypothetical protein KR018_009911 [Drosophila ironensis]
MKSWTLWALLIVATLAFVQAGKVNINGKCIDCTHDRTTTTTTRKPASSGRGGGKATPKPRAQSPPSRGRPSSSDEDDDLSGNWDLHQSADGRVQHIARRHKRQWGGGGTQYINLGSGGRGGGWPGDGPVTTIDSRGYPGTLVRNSDCVGCNIRG